MQDAALVVREVIALVVGNELDDGSFGQGRRFIENEPPLFDARLETAHVRTVRISSAPSEHSGCSMAPVNQTGPRVPRPSPETVHAACVSLASATDTWSRLPRTRAAASNYSSLD